jgi:uncharacterized protein
VPASAEAVYVDSSGLVKLVVREPESAQLVQYLRRWPRRVSSALARVEVVRAVRGHGPEAVTRARRVLAGLYLVQLDEALLDDAAELDPLLLRSLDAIHLAAARSLRGDLGLVVTYDQRMAAAARTLGLVVDAPGS